MEATIPTHVSAAYEVAGELDTALLRAAMADIVARHETLGLAFVGVEAEPRAVPAQPVEGNVKYADLSTLQSAERSAKLNRLATDDARGPFSLTSPPLLRVTA